MNNLQENTLTLLDNFLEGESEMTVTELLKDTKQEFDFQKLDEDDYERE